MQPALPISSEDARVSSQPAPRLDQLRVLLITNFIPPYLQKVFRVLGNQLGQFRVLLSVSMESDRPWEPDWQGIDVRVQKSWSVALQQRHPLGFIDTIFRHFPYDTFLRLAAFRPNVVVSAQLGFRTAQSVLYRKIFRRSRLVIWVDASEHTELSVGRLRAQLRRLLLRHADAVLAVGSSGGRYVRHLGVPADRIVEVPHVTEPGPFLKIPIRRDRDSERRLLYVGQLIERKGIAPFLNELISWIKRHPGRECEFWLLGDGPLRGDLQSIPTPPELKLRFLGNVPYQSLSKFYAQAGVCVLPTLADTWALVVNEALAAGLPVLGSLYSQAVEELIRDGENGWIYRPDKAGETQRALDLLFSTPSAELAVMRGAARKSVVRLTPEYSAKQFLEAIALTVQLSQESPGLMSPATPKEQP